jgi:hypothetical protein
VDLAPQMYLTGCRKSEAYAAPAVPGLSQLPYPQAL